MRCNGGRGGPILTFPRMADCHISETWSVFRKQFYLITGHQFRPQELGVELVDVVSWGETWPSAAGIASRTSFLNISGKALQLRKLVRPDLAAEQHRAALLCQPSPGFSATAGCLGEMLCPDIQRSRFFLFQILFVPSKGSSLKVLSTISFF